MEANSYEETAEDTGDDMDYNEPDEPEDDEEEEEEDEADGDGDESDDGTSSPPPLEGGDGASDVRGTTGGGRGGGAAAPSPDGDDDDDDDDEDDNDDATTANNNAEDNRLVISAVSDLKSLDGLRDLGPDAVCWQLSSAKPGNGVEQIRDASLEAYWQSDGQTQPHWIQVHFSRRIAISHVCLYLDYQLDESYTPKKISVDAGMTHQDLQQAIPQVELPEPSGWVILPLRSPPDPLDDYYGANDDDNDPESAINQQMDENNDLLLGSSATAGNSSRLYNDKNIVRAHLIRIIIHSMHQNGRDTHVRQVRLYGPRLNHGLASPHQSRHKNQAILQNNASASKAKKEQQQQRQRDDLMGWGGMDSIHSSRFTAIR